MISPLDATIIITYGAFATECRVYLTPRLAIDPRYYEMLSKLSGVHIDLEVDGIATTWKTEPQHGISFAFDGGDGILMPIRLHSPQAAKAA